MEIKNNTFVITGAAQGLGAAIAISLARQGAARAAHTRAAAPLRCAAFATQATVLERLGCERLRPHLQRTVLPRLLPPLREALGKGTKSKLYCAEALLSLGALAVVAGAELLARAEAVAARIAANGPLALAAIKRTVLESHTERWADAFELANTNLPQGISHLSPP